MDKDVLEVALKKLTRESSIERVIEVETNPALPKGENYTSSILRASLKVVLGNGRLARKDIIIKQVITKELSGEWLRENNVAATEAKIYSVIHKEMEYLMEEFQDTDETLWCNFIHYDPDSSSILLEDLKASGYRVVPRQKGLDLVHATLSLASLGRYHAMSKVLEERGLICKGDYKPYFLLSERDQIKSFVYSGLQNTSRGIHQSWGPRWKQTAQDLEIPFDRFLKIIQELGRYDETAFNVLNHGDCWSNNLMFKYDWRERPISVKFLDHQFPHYNSPCVDVTYLLYFGLQPIVRREHYTHLLQTYYDSLVRALDKFNYGGSKPTFQEVSAKMDRLSFFGLAIFTGGYPCLRCSSTSGADVEKLLETDGEEGYDPGIVGEPGMEENMGADVIDFVEKHLRNI